MDLSHIIGGNVNCMATLEIPSAGFFACFKMIHTSTMQARNHTYGYLPAMNWMFVTPPPKFIYWNLNPQGEDTWRWGLWKVIRSWGWSSHEWDECPYKRDPRGGPCLFHHNKTWWADAGYGPGEGLHKNTTVLLLWSWTSSPHSCEKCISVVSKSPSLWYLAIAVSMV